MWDRRVDVPQRLEILCHISGFPRRGAAIKRQAAFSSVLWRDGQPAVSNKAYFYLQYLYLHLCR